MCHEGNKMTWDEKHLHRTLNESFDKWTSKGIDQREFRGSEMETNRVISGEGRDDDGWKKRDVARREMGTEGV